MFEVQEVSGWMDQLADVPRALDDAQRIDLIGRLEQLKAATAAAQAILTADFDASQRTAQREAGVLPAKVGAGIAAQVALARRESPVRGTQHLGLAKALVHEMPCTLAAMARGRLSEWRATLLARETACVSREDRAEVDAEICRDLGSLDGKGDRALVAQARRLTYARDPHSVVRRKRQAESERRVTIRPAPDRMAHLTALLPVAQGVAAYAALRAAADGARAEGDPRSMGQVMADTLVERTTGQATADAVPVRVSLVMTDRSLFGVSDEPAELAGDGPVPAQWARDLVARSLERRAGAWVRRLFTDPCTGTPTVADRRQRRVPTGLSALIRARDGDSCRMPWCDAPIRHLDHAIPHASGGATSEQNTQGLCEACNYAKQAVGWAARPRPGPRHTVEVTTPTGHTYASMAPPMPGAATEMRVATPAVAPTTPSTHR